MKLLHYGLQRSGTNFLETLLKDNYQVSFLNSNKDRGLPLQKHFRLYKNKQIIPEPQYYNEIFVETFEQFESLFDTVPSYYLIISKDPYSWYLSYRKWAKACNWPAVKHHYIEEYNLFYGMFMEFSHQTDKIVFVRYIDLIEDTNKVLSHLEKKMRMKKRLLSKLRLKKTDRVPQSDIFTNEKQEYYLNEKYLQEYGEKDLRMLNNLLDLQVISCLGYELKYAAN